MFNHHIKSKVFNSKNDKFLEQNFNIHILPHKLHSFKWNKLRWKPFTNELDQFINLKMI